MFLAPGEDKYLATPVLGYLNDNMGGGSKPKEPQNLVLLNAGKH